MELLNVCPLDSAQTLIRIPTVPGSTGLTDPSPFATPAVNRAFLLSLQCLQAPIQLYHPRRLITSHAKGEAG